MKITLLSSVHVLGYRSLILYLHGMHCFQCKHMPSILPVICLVRTGIDIKRAGSFRLRSSAKTLFRKPSPRHSP